MKKVIDGVERRTHGYRSSAPTAFYDTDTLPWVFSAGLTEIDFTTFAPKKKLQHIPTRLVIRRIPELSKKDIDHLTLFDARRFHGLFTPSSSDTVAPDKTHCADAITD